MAYINHESLHVKGKRILFAVFRRFSKHRCDTLYLDITVSLSYVLSAKSSSPRRRKSGKVLALDLVGERGYGFLRLPRTTIRGSQEYFGLYS